MKFIGATVLVISVSACDRTSRPVMHAPDDGHPTQTRPSLTSAIPKHFDSAWVMSSRWSGFMGVAIAVSGDRYYYWFYSDVGWDGEPPYPYTGTFKIDGEVMELGFPSSLATGRVVLIDGKSELYSYRWRIEHVSNSVILHAERGKNDDSARTLILDRDFDENHPFRNQGSLTP
jgi:hypothetical protein